MPKFTPWFPPTTNPAHTGVYEVSFSNAMFRNLYARWNGKQWFSVDTFSDYAALATKKSRWVYGKDNRYIFQGWRGLAKQPK